MGRRIDLLPGVFRIEKMSTWIENETYERGVITE